HRAMLGGQYPRQVSRQPPSRDVGEGVHVDRIAKREAILDVDAGRLEQLGGSLRGELQRLSRERESVRVQAGRSETQHDIARLDPRAIEDGALLHDADAEAGQVVFVTLVEAWQLRRLTADQGASGEQAALGDALDDLLGL